VGERRLITILRFGFEGYAPVHIPEHVPDELVSFLTPTRKFMFHGYAPVAGKFSCIYIVREGEFLFSMSPNFKRDLNNKVVSEELRKVFSIHNCSLSEKAEISKDDIDVWSIFDNVNNKRYIIVDEKERLDVHADLSREITLAFFLEKEEAIFLEDIMLREIMTRRPVSETVYGGDIFMTCIVGRNPIISIPRRGFAFRFYRDKDYDKLLKMLKKYLDSTDLNEEQRKLREELRRSREQMLGSRSYLMNTNDSE